MIHVLITFTNGQQLFSWLDANSFGPHDAQQTFDQPYVEAVEILEYRP